MEIRYATPYVSGIRWRLNEISESTPVQDQSGNRAIRVEQKKPGLTFEITPYIGRVQGATQTYEFGPEPTDLPSMQDVLDAAGTDVAATWASALDQMAEIFDVLKDPVAGDEKNGPPVYLRLDQWLANLQWDGSKAVTAVLGVYKDPQYTKALAYQSLVFADGASLRQRDAQIAQLQQQIEYADSILADPPTVPNWNQLTDQQKADMKKQAPLAKKQAQDEIARMQSQLVAPLGDLLALPEVQQSVGALVAAVFSVLKASDPDWAQVDVATVMSKFVLPDVA